MKTPKELYEDWAKEPLGKAFDKNDKWIGSYVEGFVKFCIEETKKEQLVGMSETIVKLQKENKELKESIQNLYDMLQDAELESSDVFDKIVELHQKLKGEKK